MLEDDLMRGWILRVATASFVALGLGPAWAETSGFATPKDAVTAYMQGIADRDLDEIMATTAIDEMSANFDFAAYTEWMGTFSYLAPAPSHHPFLAQIGRAQAEDTITRQIKMFTYGLLSTAVDFDASFPSMDA